jgi:hypothetical protein
MPARGVRGGAPQMVCGAQRGWLEKQEGVGEGSTGGGGFMVYGQVCVRERESSGEGAIDSIQAMLAGWR